MMRKPASKLVAIWFALNALSAAAAGLNGFSIGSDALIPVREIHSGGPPRDGIPSIDKPVFVSADEAHETDPGERVLGLSYKGVVRAYPIAILNWHEIVNDRLHGEPVVVTYCPLCGSGVAFAARSGEVELTMGVSGLLYNSDVLLYDRESESLWSQMLSVAVSGPMQGTRLTMLTLVHTTWGEWLAEHPDTRILSRKTGYHRDYDRDPYSGYVDSAGIWYPVSKRDPRYHPKERVLGVELGGKFKAYPFSELSRSGDRVMDTFAGKELEVVYNAKGDTARIYDRGREIPAIVSFWFAWYAFHPDTEVYEPQ